MKKEVLFAIFTFSTILLYNCIASETYSCTYTPDGQNFQVCYESNDNNEDKAKKACAEFSGSTFGDLESCSSQDIGGRCTGVTVTNLGSVDYALYTTQGQQFCEKTSTFIPADGLGGTYVPVN